MGAKMVPRATMKTPAILKKTLPFFIRSPPWLNGFSLNELAFSPPFFSHFRTGLGVKTDLR
jgi:hypothetical protein